MALSFTNEVAGLVPARGGSKSIPHKNLAPLLGEPLLRFVIEAGRASKTLGRIFCSTEDEKIGTCAAKYGATEIQRPGELAGDDAPVVETMLHFLENMGATEAAMPWAVALLQPTSPFVLPEHIDRCVAALIEDPGAKSAQTVAPVSHNSHAFNQREVANGRVRFRFENERRIAYNKQRKPSLYTFGNIVVSRSAALLAGDGIFADPSAAVEIAREYAFDVDGPDDFGFAECIFQRKPIKFISDWLGN